MLAEADCPPAHRYLMVLDRASPGAVAITDRAVATYFAKERDRFDAASAAVTEAFLGRPQSATEASLIVAYCYADVLAGRRFEVAFDLDHPDVCEPTVAILRYGVVWGQIVSDILHHGWTQTAVIEFPVGLPHRIAGLPPDQIETHHSSRPRVGLCTTADWEEIATAPRLGRDALPTGS